MGTQLITEQTLLALMKGDINNRRAWSCAQKEIWRFIWFLEEIYMIAQTTLLSKWAFSTQMLTNSFRDGTITVLQTWNLRWRPILAQAEERCRDVLLLKITLLIFKARLRISMMKLVQYKTRVLSIIPFSSSERHKCMRQTWRSVDIRLLYCVVAWLTCEKFIYLHYLELDLISRKTR